MPPYLGEISCSIPEVLHRVPATQQRFPEQKSLGKAAAGSVQVSRDIPNPFPRLLQPPSPSLGALGLPGTICGCDPEQFVPAGGESPGWEPVCAQCFDNNPDEQTWEQGGEMGAGGV